MLWLEFSLVVERKESDCNCTRMFALAEAYMQWRRQRKFFRSKKCGGENVWS